MSEEERKKFDQIYEALKNTYHIESDTQFSLNVRQFDSFASNKTIHQSRVLSIPSELRHFYLNFLKVTYHAPRSRYSPDPNEEFQTWGYFKLKEDYGRIILTTETIRDKIYDLLTPMDIDFKDDPEFSQRFFVVSTDKDKARHQLSTDFRDLVKQMTLKEGIIEINGQDLIIGNKKVTTVENTLQIAAFLNKLALHF
jgi:hypothetical protein